MNESKSTRYHRLVRRAGLLVAGAWVAALAGMLIARPDLSRPLYVLLVVSAAELLALPAEFYRGHVLERRFGLSSQGAGYFARQHAIAFVARVSLLALAVEALYFIIEWQRAAWWIPAAALASLIAALFSWLSPMVLPLFFKVKPIHRPSLAARLVALSAKAGVRALGVYEWAFGEKTTRANAVLAGAGTMRRILVSDTMLADYSDEEIEVVVAHELGHHVHRDIPKALALEILLVFGGFGLTALVLEAFWQPIGLAGAADVRGLPMVLLTLGGVFAASGPLINAVSRHNERRADRYALTLTQRPDAFISAMRRLGAQNLVEESPSRAAVWLFHRHPPIEERIADAQMVKQ
jgi:STE24 endopeptidase